MGKSHIKIKREETRGYQETGGRQRNFILTEYGRKYLALIKVPERAIIEYPKTFEDFCREYDLIKDVDFKVEESPEKVQSTYNKPIPKQRER